MSQKKTLIISICLGIYLALVTSPIDWNLYNYIVFVVKTVVFSILINKVINYIDKINMTISNKKITKKTYFIWAIYIFLVMILALFIYYPVNFTYDLNNQYEQAITGIYSDWHPIIHTLIFYRFPTLLIKSKLMCSFFQMFFVIFILLYFCRSLEKYGFNKYAITIILSLFILNPSFDYMAVSPVKDLAYSYCIFLMTIYLMNIYLSDGEWISKKINLVAFLLVSFGLSFFRHNGIGTFILVLIPMMFIYKNIRKYSIIIFLTILGLRFIFVPYIYKLNNIKKTTFTFSETICIMLNQISYIYNHNGNITDKQYKTLEKMQDLKVMKNYYNPYDYDTIKFSSRFYDVYSPYINQHKKEFLKLWYELVMNNKKQAFKGYLYATYLIWHIDVNTEQDLRDLSYLYFKPNPNTISEDKIVIQNNYLDYKKNLCHLPFSLIFISSSCALFLILFSLFYNLRKVKDKLKLLIPYLPVLTNLAVVMLIIPGREARFTYPNLLCVFPLVIFMLLIKKKNKKIGV